MIQPSPEPFTEGGDAIFDGGGDEDVGVAGFDEAGAFCEFDDVAFESGGAQFVELSAVGSHRVQDTDAGGEDAERVSPQATATAVSTRRTRGPRVTARCDPGGFGGGPTSFGADDEDEVFGGGGMEGGDEAVAFVEDEGVGVFGENGLKVGAGFDEG